MQRRRLPGLLATLALLSASFVPALQATAAPAAQANLLVNGSFDSGFYNANGNVDIQVANGWAPWHENTAKSDCPPCDYVLQPKWISEFNTALVQQGSASQHVGNQYDPWHGGVFQTVSVPANTRVRFTAYIRVRASNEQYPAPSYTNFNSRAQVGMDPNGNGLWTTGVAWSGTINPHDAWQPVSIDATVGAAGKVSVYIAASWRGQAAAHLDVWFDNASLVALDTQPTPVPGQTNAPPPPPPAPNITPFPTPTPGQDGRVVYIVKPGDSMWHIAAVAGLTVEELKALNSLTSDIVVVGQQLLLATVAAPATPVPTATLEGQPAGGGQGEATPLPTPQPRPTAAVVATGDICYMLYEDVNGNGLRDAGEGLIPGGQFLISNANGQPVDTYTTTSDAAQEPHCTRELAVGGYNISVSPPSGYNTTTNRDFPLTLDAGATVNLEFGAQQSATASAPGATDGGDAAGNTRLRTALYGAVGVVFLLLAAGLAGFLFLSRRSG